MNTENFFQQFKHLFPDDLPLEIRKTAYDGYYISERGDLITTKQKTKLMKFTWRGKCCKYATSMIMINGIGKQYKLHRLVAESFIPNPDNKPFVCHIDGDTTNNHFSNLYWGTHAENMADRTRHGTTARNPLLKPEVVTDIRKLHNAGIPNAVIQKTISNVHGVVVPKPTLRDIKFNRTWKHV